MTTDMNVDTSAGTVLVTGITGFLASHIVDCLLKSGYKVVGTARTTRKADLLVSEFKNKYLKAEFIYELVKDITVDHAFKDVLEKHHDIKYIMHTASPYVFGLDLPLKEAYLDPALKGTVNILKDTKSYAPQVTNVVITSSFASIGTFPHKSDSVVYTNKDWNPVQWDDVNNETDAYYASKTYAERASWEFMSNESPNFQLTTICPPYIFGPQVFESLVDKELNVSNEVIVKFLKMNDKSDKEYEPSKIAGFGIDVRDVAKFHQLAIENKNLEGQRAFISEAKFCDQYFLDILSENYPNKKFVRCRKPVVALPGFDISNVVEMVGSYKFITHKQSVLDTVDQYLKVHAPL